MSLPLTAGKKSESRSGRWDLRGLTRETNRFAAIPASSSRLVADALADSLAALPPSLHEPARFHFAKPGKLLRGQLAVTSALALGWHESQALAWATSVELLHNASLIHDDICDRDLNRRGQESVLRRYGEAVALCLGDYLIARAFAKAAEAHPQLTVLVSQAMGTLAGGQAAEFTTVGYPGLQAYTRIAIAKTAPLLSLAVTGSLALAGQQESCRAVDHYFGQAALCFQIINDLNNFSGDDGANNPCSDLANCRPNAVISCFRDSLPEQQCCLFELWAERIRSGSLIADTVETRAWWHSIRESGAFTATADFLQDCHAEAGVALLALDETLQSTLQPMHAWLQQQLSRQNAVRRQPE